MGFIRRERRKAETVSRDRPGEINAQSPKSVIPSEEKESPGEMLRFGTAYQEIATGFALAMTEVVDGLLRRNQLHP